MGRCGFGDCGDASCGVCAAGRLPQPDSRLPPGEREGLRADARATPQARPRVVKVSKRKYRKGPHR